MGMFDSVYVDCECGGRAEFQSKAGECILTCYNEHDMPAEIAADLKGEYSYCDKCNAMCELFVSISVNAHPKWHK